MRPHNQPPPPGQSSIPERLIAHASFLVGQRATRLGSELNFESGYQALRLSTELVPATLAILGTEQVSPFWAVLFYFILILFGVAQQVRVDASYFCTRSFKSKSASFIHGIRSRSNATSDYLWP
jgi:solute carrier family 6 (neurotransmitter transporter)